MGFEKVVLVYFFFGWDQFVLQESIEKATRQLARLRMVDEVNKMLDLLGWVFHRWDFWNGFLERVQKDEQKKARLFSFVLNVFFGKEFPAGIFWL